MTKSVGEIGYKRRPIDYFGQPDDYDDSIIWPQEPGIPMKTPPKGRSGRKRKRERPSPTTSTEGNTPKKINLNASSSEANSEEEDQEENDNLVAAFKLITGKNRRKKNKAKN